MKTMKETGKMKNVKIRPTGLRIEVKKDKKTKDLKGVNMILTDGDRDLTVKMDMELLGILRDVADGILHQKELDDISDGYRIAGE